MENADRSAEITWPAMVAPLPCGMVFPMAITPPSGAIWTDWPATRGAFMGPDDGGSVRDTVSDGYGNTRIFGLDCLACVSRTR